MVQLVSVACPRKVNRPPPSLAELPLTVQLVSVVVPSPSSRPPPPKLAELPLTVQLLSVVVPPPSQAAAAVGGVVR